MEIFTAPPGTGKTSLMVAKLIDHMIGPTARADVSNCRRLLMQLRANGFEGLSAPTDHLVYSDVDIKYRSSRHGTKYNHNVDGFRLGFPAEGFNPMFILPGSYIGLDEAQRYFNSREFQSFSDNISRWYEQHRHFGLTIYFTAQRDMLIDKNIRELCSVSYIRKLQTFNNADGKVIRCVWQYDHWDTYSAFVNQQRPNSLKYTFEGNVFQFYDCCQSKHLFLNGVDGRGFDFDYAPYYDLSPDGVKQYAEAHRQEAPDCFRKKKKK